MLGRKKTRSFIQGNKVLFYGPADCFVKQDQYTVTEQSVNQFN